MPKLFALNFRSGLAIGCAIAIAVAAGAFAYDRYDTKTLKRTIRRDAVFCGVNTGLPGFSSADEKGNWSGFDVDFCRAIAAAIFDDPAKVKFIPLDSKERFTELQKRKVDVLARNSTWTISRETDYALHFVGVSYYDGQGFMVPKARKVDSGLELDASKVCVQVDTTTELNLDDYFRANNMKYEAVKFAKVDDVFKAYESGQCNVLTSDVSQLYALRQKLPKPGDHTILPDVISKEPLAPVVRQKDDDWLLIVKWTLFAMLNAEDSASTRRTSTRRSSPKSRTLCALSAPKVNMARAWASPTTGRCGLFVASETTAKSMNATSAPARSSAYRAASINCGMPAAFCTRRRSASHGSQVQEEGPAFDRLLHISFWAFMKSRYSLALKSSSVPPEAKCSMNAMPIA